MPYLRLRSSERPLRGGVAIALMVLVQSFFAVTARASPSARLVYSHSSDADSCPDEEALRRAVAARVGYDPLASAPSDRSGAPA